MSIEDPGYDESQVREGHQLLPFEKLTRAERDAIATSLQESLPPGWTANWQLKGVRYALRVEPVRRRLHE